MPYFKSIRPYDRVIVGDRNWSVAAVRIGALGHESSVELVPADGTIPSDAPYLVPFDLIPHEAIFRAVDHDDEGHPDEG